MLWHMTGNLNCNLELLRLLLPGLLESQMSLRRMESLPLDKQFFKK